MDSRRRRSSILKKVSEEDRTVDGTMKLKRRSISFSGKKSIRIFRGEVPPQAWSNSYEESDNAINASVDAEKEFSKGTVLKSDNAGPSINRILNIKSNVQHNLLQDKTTKIDKENMSMGEEIELNISAPISEQPLIVIRRKTQAQRPTLTSQKCINNSFPDCLCTTMDFINNSNCINSLHIENSVDVSLHDREYYNNFKSFSIEEYEREELLNAKRVISKCSSSESVVPSTDKVLKSNHQPLNSSVYLGNLEYEDESNRITVLSKEIKEESILVNKKESTILGCQTINIEDPVSANEMNRTVQKLNQKTMLNIENMDVTVVDIQQMPKAEHNTPENYTSMELSRVDCDQEFSPPVNKKQQKDPKDYISHGKEVKESRKTIIFDTKSSQLDISKSNTPPSSPTADVRKESLSSSAHLPHEEKSTKCRKTIIFDDTQLDISKSNKRSHTASVEIKMRTVFEEACNKLDITQPIASPKASPKKLDKEFNSVINNDKKGAVRKVVLVRKVRASNHKQDAVKEYELQRFKKYVNKGIDTKFICNRTTSDAKDGNEISPNEQNTSLSIDMSSPLFSDKFIQASNKKFNFRQLNDEIELGKLKIFPKTPTNSASKFKNSGGSILKEETEKSVCAYEEYEKNEESDMMSFEKTLPKLSCSQSKEKTEVLDSKVFCSEKNTLIFSDSKQMQLEDTLFLTKLEDNTISLHKLKYSNIELKENFKPKLNFEFDTEAEGVMKSTFNECTNEQIDVTNLEEDSLYVSSDFQVKNVTQEAIYKKDINERNTIDQLGTIKNELNSKTSLINSNNGSKASIRSKRQTLLFKEREDMDLGDVISDIKEEPNSKVEFRNKQTTFNFSEENQMDTEDMDLSDVILDMEERKNSQFGLRNRQTIYNFSEENQMNAEDMELGGVILDIEENKNTKSNEMDADHLHITTDKTIKNFNVAKHILSKQYSVVSSLPNDSNALEDSLNLQLKEMLFKRNCNKITSNNSIGSYESPQVNNRRQTEVTCRFNEGTPHHSILEFEHLELETEMDKLGEKQQCQFNLCNPVEIGINDYKDHINQANEHKVVEPDAQRKIIFNSQEKALNAISVKKTDVILEDSGLKSLHIDDQKDDVFSAINVTGETSRKRSTCNLTPVHSEPKKKHTQYFADCNIHEKFSNNNNAGEQNISQQAKESAGNEAIKEIDTDVCGDQHVPQICIAAAPEIHLNVTDEDLKRSPVLFQTTRIPIYIDSAKKNYSILTRFLSPLKTNESDMDHSSGTIAIPRRATTVSNRKDSFFFGNDMQFNDTQTKSNFEENPITISDVSVFYVSQREKAVGVCNDCPNQGTLQLRESSEDNTVNNTAKRYMDLTCDSPRLSSSADIIDETRLSLVETLLDDENDDDDDDGDQLHDDKLLQIEKEKSEDLQSTFNIKAYLTQTPAASVRTLRNSSAVCLKCKRCQETILNETSSSDALDSFVLPKMPSKLDLGLDRLNLLRSKPTIAEVSEYWRRVNFNRAITSKDLIIDEDDEVEEDDDADIFIKAYRDRMKRNEIEIAEQRCKQVILRTFVKRLEIKLRSARNWIFDYQMQCRNLYLFDHRKINTFSVIICYMEIDDFGYDIEVKSIKLQPSRVPRKNWKPYSYVLDFQLKLELPFDICTLCSGSDVDSIFKLLTEIDRICDIVEKLGQSFWKLVCSEKASLIRELNTIYVRKTVRGVLDPLAEKSIKMTEFKIGITNLRKICYKDIVAPPLHLFREDIQYLPIGFDFLKIFLKDPMSFVKFT